MLEFQLINQTQIEGQKIQMALKNNENWKCVKCT